MRLTLPNDSAGWRSLAGRAALLALLALVAFIAVRSSLGIALAGRGAALRIDPANSIALARAALDRAQTDQTDAGRVAARDLGLRAILRDPTSATALTALGLASVAPQDGRLMRASEALSRRSLYGQLWLIEDAVRRNDVDGALRHYDIALRTSRQAPAILFSVLVEAVGDRTLLPALAKRLAMRPEWGPLYLQQLAQAGTNLDNIAWLFTTLRRRGVDVGDPALAALYPRLVAANRFEDAWSIYAAGHSRAPRLAVRSIVPPGTPSPFDWSPVSAEAATFQAVDGGVSFAAVADGGGVAGRQLLLLPTGQRVLRFTVRDHDGGGNPAFLRVECAKGGRELGRQPLAQGSRTQTLTFVIPSGCDAQWLTLNLPPSDLPSGTGGTVEGFAVR